MATSIGSSAQQSREPGLTVFDRASSRVQRIVSIDIIRGAVMVLMAVDHVRVYAGVPPGGPTAGVFFTRWITHFCAPAFIFLAGTAAFLHGEKLGDRRTLSRWLLVRGAWLILLELTVIRLAWTFNFDYGSYLLGGVIWVIGWCMILQAGLVRLPLAVSAVLGVVMIAGHNLLDPAVASLGQWAEGSGWGWLAQVLYLGGGIPLGGNGPPLIILYSIVPWIGVMAAGYAFGQVMRTDMERRRRLCLWIGGGMIAAFLVLRGFDLYGDPRPWSEAPAQFPRLLAFLNTTKYPASLSFLLMTLGPTLVLIPLLEHARGWLANVLSVFGRVPFFYYLLHIPLIHVLAVAVSLARYGEIIPWLTANHPVMVPPPPDGWRWSLPMLYAVTIGAVVLLYFPCRWYAELKRRRHDAWLSLL